MRAQDRLVVMTDMTASQRINPPAHETTSEQDFRAKVKYYIDENVGDLAYHYLDALQIIAELSTRFELDDAMKKRIETVGRAKNIAEYNMSDEDVLAPIEEIGWLKAALSEQHEGDCVACPCGCSRCHAEDYYDLPTSRTWCNKSEGWAVYQAAKREREA